MGTLDPNAYGRYTLQDCAYCAHALDDYTNLAIRALQAGFADLSAFALARAAGYRTYNRTQFSAWGIQPFGVIASPATRTYLDLERLVCGRLHPIYGLAVMMPCDILWPWLATQLAKRETHRVGNLYDFWITGNQDWHGAYRLDNFFDAWLAAHPGIYDPQLGLLVFQSALTCEVNLFQSACGQPLQDMPQAYAKLIQEGDPSP